MKQIGIIGFGKMGLNLAKNIKKNNYDVIGYDLNKTIYKELDNYNIKHKNEIKELIQSLDKPRSVIMIVNSGKPTEAVFNELSSFLEKGDCIIDAGNSFYKDSVSKYNLAKEKGINFIDAGVSGGPSGALNGCCIMAGGNEEIIKNYNDFFTKICVPNGYLYTGEPGSGHFAKMVHNGIEYGMMQAIAEGYQIINNSNYNFDLSKLSTLWNNGSVIRSWLVELMVEVFKKDPNLNNYSDVMSMNGEGLWTLQEALKQGTPAPIIGLSVMLRQNSTQQNNFAAKVISALRNSFGGHEIIKK
ncbi:6-phosphogluconate dehydrogenase [Spiroplasma litorale]|uniref:6-phosphogluconate dehydrogenase n=1 Tax=Spiroplasma litorale TaxID=216942 RepID=A0A0K1W1J4_9MOLU|nr:decarboxylating 6-phosphogluconate dehydrogenase [Spiroplasma litorale]AKX34194.1 6-phosphogluconate dehydrogenase [Spiroplasma litorale]